MNRALLSLLVLLLAPACSHAKNSYRWVEEAPEEAPPPADRGYVIAPGDMLSVRVWNQESMSSHARVRADGKISVPLANEVDAAGRTPAQVSEAIAARLKDYLNEPQVTVAVEEAKPFPISIVGEVVRPGVYPLEPGAGVLDALATAGGLTEFAGSDRIYVIRRVGARGRLRFRYEDLARAEGRSAGFRLRPGDVVVVE